MTPAAIAAAAVVRRALDVAKWGSESDAAVKVAVIAGSGLAELSGRVASAVRLRYEDIPGWPIPTVDGHRGELVMGILGGVRVAVASGRVHLYEGYSPAQIVFGVELLASLGAEAVVVTNAAGGLDPDMAPGDVMVVADHLFLPGLAGASPLVGAHTSGERFPMMLGAYDRALRTAFLAAAAQKGLTAHEGVYAMVAGPSFETPAEARMLRSWGADAVGMSTVPEVVAARLRGLRVLAISVIANRVAIVEPEAASPASLHDDVQAVCGGVAPLLGDVLESMLEAGAVD